MWWVVVLFNLSKLVVGRLRLKFCSLAVYYEFVYLMNMLGYVFLYTFVLYCECA